MNTNSITIEATDQPAAGPRCGATTTTALGDHECAREPHVELGHRDGKGTSWRPRTDTAEQLAEALIADFRHRDGRGSFVWGEAAQVVQSELDYLRGQLDWAGQVRAEEADFARQQDEAQQRGARVVKVTMALSIDDVAGYAVFTTHEGEIGRVDRRAFLETIASEFGVTIAGAGDRPIYPAGFVPAED